MQIIDSLIEKLRATENMDLREEIKASIISHADEFGASNLREYVESALKKELLEVKWELEDVVDALSPKSPSSEPEPEPEPQPTEEEDPSRLLRPSELELVYQDPAGLRLFRSKIDDRWVVSQIDPRIGQPVTYEVSTEDVQRIKSQLAGSPYWIRPI